MSDCNCFNPSHKLAKFMKWRKFEDRNGIIWKIHWNNPLVPCLTNNLTHWNHGKLEQSEYSESDHDLVFFRDQGLGRLEKATIHKNGSEYRIEFYLNSNIFFYDSWEMVNHIPVKQIIDN